MLVVDDQHDAREVTSALARSLGCRVDEAVDGADAIRQILRCTPDVVLMDLDMPIVDGWDAMRRLRDLPVARRPYFVAVSALVNEDARRRAFAAGCREYVIKPFDVRALLNAYAFRHGRTLAD